jgi:hypothetical protein
MIHLPIFVTEVIYDVIGNRFPLAASLEAAFLRTAFLFLALSLPILAFASLTRNLMETIAGAVAIGLGFVAFATVAQGFHWELNMLQLVPWSGLAWAPTLAMYLVILAGSVIVVLTQYLRRRTAIARSTAVLVCLFCFVGINAFPWEPAFAVQQKVAKEPGAGAGVRVSHEPTLGRYTRPEGVSPQSDWGVYIPVLVEGLPEDTILRADLSYAESIDIHGIRKPFSLDPNDDFRSSENGDSNLDFHGNGPGHLRLAMEPITGWAPDSPLNNGALKNNPFQLDITLSLTLLRLTQSVGPELMTTIKPFGAPCAHRTWSIMGGSFKDRLASEVEFYCTPVLNPPTCLTMTVENPPSPYVFKPMLNCPRTYGPYRDRLLPGGEEVYATALLRDPEGLKRSNEGLDIRLLDVTLRGYEPVDHFVRKVTVPGMRMEDWKPVVAKTQGRLP